MVDKPVGLPSQPSQNHSTDLYTALCQNHPYVGLHHRLDTPTSGLLLLPPTKDTIRPSLSSLEPIASLEVTGRHFWDTRLIQGHGQPLSAVKKPPLTTKLSTGVQRFPLPRSNSKQAEHIRLGGMQPKQATRFWETGAMVAPAVASGQGLPYMPNH